jgi:hypothetical protein
MLPKNIYLFVEKSNAAYILKQNNNEYNIHFSTFLGSIQYSNTSMGFVSFGRRKGINSYGVQYSQDAQTIHHASW